MEQAAELGKGVNEDLMNTECHHVIWIREKIT